MKDVIIDSYNKQLYVVKNLSKFDATGELITPIPKDTLRLLMNSEGTGSFDNLIVTRVEDIELERIYIKNSETGEDWIPETQNIGEQLSCPPEIKVYAHFETPSNIEIEDQEFDFDPSCVTLYDDKGAQESNIITENTQKFKYTFTNGAFEQQSDFISFDINYEIDSVNVSFDDVVYENTEVVSDNFKIHVTFSSGETFEFPITDIPDFYDITIIRDDTDEELESTWPDAQNDFRISLTLKYTGVDGTFEEQEVSVDTDVDILPDKVQSFTINSQTVHSAFYGSAPDITVNSIIATFLSGKVGFISDPEDITFESIPLQYDSSGKGLLTKEVSVLVHYNDTDRVVSELSVQSPFFIACAKITDISVDSENPIPDQYSGSPLDIRGTRMNVTFNIKETSSGESYISKNLLMSAYFTMTDDYDCIESGIWTYNPDSDTTQPLKYSYTDFDTREVVEKDYDFTLLRNTVSQIIYKGNTTTSVPSNGLFTEYKQRFPVDLVYSNGTTVKNVYPNRIERDGVELTNFDKFGDNESEINRRIYFDAIYEDGTLHFDSSSDYKVYITRTARSITPYKEDDSQYHFEDDEQQMNHAVNLESLDHIIVIFYDESTYRLDLEEENKIQQLSNHGISLFKNIWGYQQTQRNYFGFAGVKYEEDYVFSTQIYTITNVEVASGERLFQGDTILDDEDETKSDIENKLNFYLEIRDASGDRVIVKYKKSEIDAIGGNLTVKNLTEWPCDTSENIPQSFRREITFSIKPKREGAFRDIERSFYLDFYRVPTKLELAVNSGDSYRESINLDHAAVGDYISTADYGAKQRVTFRGGSYIEDINFDYVKTVEHDGSVNYSKSVLKWPETGQFALVYDEFNDVSHSVYAIITCTGITHRLAKISATLLNTNIVAGSNISKSDFNVKKYGLINEYMGDIQPDDPKLSITPDKTESTDSSILVTISYLTTDEADNQVTMRTQVTVPLIQKVCEIDYDVYNITREESLLDHSTIAAKYSYSPNVSNQNLQVKIETPKTASGLSLYTYYSLEVTTIVKIDGVDTEVKLDEVLDEKGQKKYPNPVVYDSVKERLTIPAKLDVDLTIRFNYTTEFILDDYNHAYCVTPDGVLSSVHELAGSKSIYEIPSEVLEIPSLSTVFNGNSSVQKVIIPGSVLRICDSAFSKCSYLQEVQFKERSEKISIGRNAFYDCTSLTTLDFLECGDIRNYFIIGTPDDDPIDGNVIMNTWRNCKLSVIKIAKSSFTRYLRCHYIDNSIGHPQYWMTGRCGGGFKMQFEFSHKDNRETWMAAVKGTGTGTGEPSNADIAFYVSSSGDWSENLYTKTFKTFEHGTTHDQKIKTITSCSSNGTQPCNNAADCYHGQVSCDNGYTSCNYGSVTCNNPKTCVQSESCAYGSVTCNNPKCNHDDSCSHGVTLCAHGSVTCNNPKDCDNPKSCSNRKTCANAVDDVMCLNGLTRCSNPKDCDNPASCANGIMSCPSNGPTPCDVNPKYEDIYCPNGLTTCATNPRVCSDAKEYCANERQSCSSNGVTQCTSNGKEDCTSNGETSCYSNGTEPCNNTIIGCSHGAVSGSYDFRAKDAGMIRSDRNANTWLMCFGLGLFSDEEYRDHVAFYENSPLQENYRFTTNGRDGSTTNYGLEFVSVEVEKYGHDFWNWDMSEYVNNCIYPNVKLESTSLVHRDFSDEDVGIFFNVGYSATQKEQFNMSIGGTYLDLMIPLYV